MKNLRIAEAQKLPTPEFIALYNGEDEIGEDLEYRLSDLFAAKPGFGRMEIAARGCGMKRLK
jgi:hypothetical protein